MADCGGGPPSALADRPTLLGAVSRISLKLGIIASRDIVTYCRIGERSSFSWFVLKYLLGYPNVRNYDGSWTEWGNLVRNPIEKPSLAIAQTVPA